MNHNTPFLTIRPNHELFFRKWPIPAPKAVVVISHGLGEHSGRYERLAAAWNSAGYAVVAYDKGGHGKSSGKQGCIPDIEVYFDELDSIAAYCREEHPGLPLILYGQSMGTTVGLAYVLRKPDTFQAMIASSGWLKLVKEPSSLTIKLAAWLGPVFPGLTLSNGLDPKQISSLPDEVRHYREDPLVHNRISLALGNGIFGLLQQLNTYKGTFPVPLLVLHSQDDPITDFQGSRDFATRVGGKVSFVSFSGSLHELHHDKDADKVLNSQLEWLNQIQLA